MGCHAADEKKLVLWFYWLTSGGLVGDLHACYSEEPHISLLFKNDNSMAFQTYRQPAIILQLILQLICGSEV